MPLIEIAAPTGALSKPDQDSMIARISDAVLKSETANPADPAAQSLVWAYYHDLGEGGAYVGGEALAKAPMTIAVTTPAGALTPERRATLVGEIASIVDELVGVFPDRLNHWTMLYELAEGSWGAGGQIAPLAGIQAAMNIARAHV